MDLRVVVVDGGHRLAGEGTLGGAADPWLAPLGARQFAPMSVRARAVDMLNFARFLDHARLGLGEVAATDVFDWLAWQREPLPSRGRRVVRLRTRQGAAPATMNRRVAAVRGLFDYAVMSGDVEAN